MSESANRPAAPGTGRGMGALGQGFSGTPAPSASSPPGAVAQRGMPLRTARLNGQAVVMILGLGVLGLLIVLPLAAVVGQAVFPHAFSRHPSLAFDASALVRVIKAPADFHMLADSVLMSAGAALVSALIGGALALVVGRTDIPGRGLWHGLVWCCLLLPSFLLTEGWTFFLQREGLLSRILPEPAWLPNIFGNPWGVGAILALKFFPFAFLTVSAALPWVGGEHEAAARTLGAGRAAIWRRIYLPLLLPFFAGGAAIVFADVLSDFGVAITVAESHQFPLLTYGIYSSLYDMPTDFGGAGALSLLLSLAVGAALAVQFLILRGHRYATISTGYRPPVPAPLGRMRLPATVAMAAFFLVALGFPAGSIVVESFMRTLGFAMAPNAFTLGNFTALAGSVGERAASALFFSLRLAAVTATIVVLLGTLLAYLGTHGAGWVGHILEGISLWTISVPGLILAAGYVFLWNQPWLVPLHLDLYGTVWALLLCYLAGGMPYVLRFQLGAMGQLDGRLLSAARVLGAGIGRLLWRIVLPLLAEGGVALWLFILAGTAFELPASEFLYPPGHPTLAVEVNHYFNTGLYGQGTALAVTAGFGLVAFVLILRFFLSRVLPSASNDGSSLGPVRTTR